MAIFQDVGWIEAVVGAVLLFFLMDRGGWLAFGWPMRISPLFLSWGEMPRYIKKVNQEFGFLNTLGLGRQIAIYLLSSNSGAEKPNAAAAPARREKLSDKAFDVEQIMQRVLNEKKTLLMIGAPTSGKTTLLQVLAVRSADREGCRHYGFAAPRIPFYVPAKEIDFELPFLAAVQQALSQTSCPISSKGLKRAIRARRALFLLDGLDEIPAGGRRRKACTWIEAAQQWCGGDVPFIVTCRAAEVFEGVQFKIPHLTVAIRNFALLQYRSLRAVSESRMPPRFFNAAEDRAEYALISPPSVPVFLLGAKKSAPAYYYYLAKFPVTNRLYRKFVEATSHRPPAFWDDPEFNGDDCPVVGVDWEDAQAYCAWLTQQEVASSKAIEAAKVIYRPPLEEEWEWAAGEGKRKYPWGNNAPKNTQANFNGVGQGLTPVHAFPGGATPEGLMDMAGNVWEWTSTWLDECKEQHVVRGGAGFNDEVALRCVARDSNFKKPMRFVGFRVTRIVPD